MRSALTISPGALSDVLPLLTAAGVRIVEDVSLIIESDVIPDCERVTAVVHRSVAGSAITFSVVFYDADEYEGSR